MCKLKSGLLFKAGVFVPDYDSHDRMLQEKGIEDTAENRAMGKYIRFELSPKNDDPFTPVSSWVFRIDQDELPEWYEAAPGKYEQMAREAVEKWASKRIFVGKEIAEIKQGENYYLKDCTVGTVSRDTIIADMRGSSAVQNMRDSSVVRNMLDSSAVQNMWESSVVQNMLDSSVVQDMWGSSVVQDMWGSSVVQDMRDSSAVRNMRGRSAVRDMRDSSVVQDMWDNSVVQNMRDSSVVRNLYEKSIAICRGKSVIYVSSDFPVKLQ